MEPKVGQIWTNKADNKKEFIQKIAEQRIITDCYHHYADKFTECYFFDKEETLKHLKQQQEEIKQQIEELNKPEIVKHKFEVIVHAPENFNPNEIFNSLECTVYNYWTDGDITNYSVDVIKE